MQYSFNKHRAFNLIPKLGLISIAVAGLLAAASMAFSSGTVISSSLKAEVNTSVSNYSGPSFVEGKDYVRLDNPQPTASPNKIEVVEMFWYGCSHCFHFEPRVNEWKKTLGEDVYFHQIPAIWNGTMETHARAFYVSKALNALDKTHDATFDALNVPSERRRLNSRRQVSKFYEELGVDAKKFDKTWGSFWINSQIAQSKQRALAYQIGGTPEMIVNGKFRISSRTSGSHERMLMIADFLIDQERSEEGE